jgi:hypothetical protein
MKDSIEVGSTITSTKSLHSDNSIEQSIKKIEDDY